MNSSLKAQIGLGQEREPTLVCFAIKLHLIRLHHFLNRLSDVTQTHINTGVLQHTQKIMNCRHVTMKQFQPEARVCGSCTLIPVLVASLTASSSLSYFGLNVTVKAQSIIRPADRHRGEKHLSSDAHIRTRR